MIKKLLSIFFLTTTSVVFSVEDLSSSSFKQGYALEENQLSSGYNAASRIDLQRSWDVFASASFLYWFPREKGLELGVFVEQTAPGTVIHKNLNFEYKPGFKVDFGFNLPQDHWTLDLEYTRYHADAHTSATALSGYTFFSQWQSTKNVDMTMQKTMGHWNLKIDLLDLKLQRPCYLGTHVTIRPSLGIRGGWLDQKYVAKDLNVQSLLSTTKNKEDSWLLGLRGGLGANILLGKGFRIFGDGYASLCYQKVTVSAVEQSYSNPSVIFANTHVPSSEVMFAVEGFAGFGYGTYFCHQKYHVDLLLGYDFQVLFDQNWLGLGEESAIVDSLILHGLVATARFDF